MMASQDAVMDDCEEAFLNLSRRPDLFEDPDALKVLKDVIRSLGTRLLREHSQGGHASISIGLADDQNCELVSHVDENPFITGLVTIYKQCALKLLFIAGKVDKNPVLACSDIDVVTITREILRVLRILCGVVPNSQVVVEQAGFHESLIRALSNLERLYGGSEIWGKEVQLLTRDFMKFVVNLIQSNPNTCLSMVDSFGDSNTLQQLAWFVVVHDAATIELLSYMFYSLVNNAPDKASKASAIRILLSQERPGSSALSVLLGGFVNDTASGVRRDQAFDSILWIIEQVFRCQDVALLEMLWECKSEKSHISPEQLVILKMMEELFGLREGEVAYQEYEDDEAADEARDIEQRETALRRLPLETAVPAETRNQISKIFGSWFVDVLNPLDKVDTTRHNGSVVETVNSKGAREFTEATQGATVEHTPVVETDVGTAESAETTQGATVEGTTVVDTDVGTAESAETTQGATVEDTPVVEADDITGDTFDILRSIREDAAVSLAALVGHVVGSLDGHVRDHESDVVVLRSALCRLAFLNHNVGSGREGERSKLVRVIGNMCFRQPQVQDAVRGLNGIPAVLNCCNIDTKNPWLREWGLFAVRNLCENNVENQQVIDSLRVQGTVQHPIIAKAGLKVELTEDGRPKMVKLSESTI